MFLGEIMLDLWMLVYLLSLTFIYSGAMIRNQDDFLMFFDIMIQIICQSNCLNYRFLYLIRHYQMEKNLSHKLITKGEHNISFPAQNSPDGTGYYSHKNNTSQYGLVLIQEWWGLNQSLCTTADHFAGQGYQVLVPDIYRGKCAKNREDAGHYMDQLDWKGAINDIAAAKKFLEGKRCKKIGILGFCMGGALTIAAAAMIPGFDAAAPFYGIPDLNTYHLENIKCKFQGHFGQLDQAKGFSDAQSAKALEAKLKKTNPHAQVIIWPGANHAFMNQDGPNYHAKIAQQALAKTKEIFK